MDHLSSALSLVSPNCVFASLDLADAYYSVNVNPEHRKYLQFAFQGNHYQFTCLANGVSSAPRTFTKLMKVPLSKLRAQFGLLISVYLDDLLIIADSPEELLKAVDVTQSLLRSLGFSISLKKSTLIPSHNITFLGFALKSTLMRVTLPVDKTVSLQKSLAHIKTQHQPLIRQFATLVGKLTATLPANRYGRIFLKHLEMAKAKALCKSAFNYDFPMNLTPKVENELDW